MVTPLKSLLLADTGAIVAQVLEIREQKRYLAGKKAFESWRKRFHESFDIETRPEDLTEAALSILIEGTEEASMPLYEFIMGALGLGKGPRFYSLETAEILLVTDISLFLLDQLRFEAMRRMDWVEDWPTLHIPLLDLVLDYAGRFSSAKHATPDLSATHPLFPEYQRIFQGDRPSFVRRLIPDAVRAFQEQFGTP